LEFRNSYLEFYFSFKFAIIGLRGDVLFRQDSTLKTASRIWF